MNVNNLSSLQSLLNIAESNDDFHSYENHPEDALIERYVDGSIPASGRSLETIRDNFSSGQITEWGRAEVALHVKTCQQCWDKVSEIRIAQRKDVEIAVPESPVAVNQISIVDKILSFIDSIIQPGPRLAMAGAFLVIIGIGIGVISTSTSPTEDIAALPSPSILSGGTNPQVATIGTALETFGIDVSAYDFEQQLYIYRVQEGDTLSSVAAEKLGGADNWIVVLLINYETLSSSDAADAALTPGSSIFLPLLAE